MIIDWKTSSKLFIAISLGIVATLVLFMKTDPDSRLAKWRREEHPWKGLRMMLREDGSLRKYTKITLFFIFVVIIAIFWIGISLSKY